MVTLACQRTDAPDRPRHGWSLQALAATIINEAHAETISRATVWRILQAADLHPHKSVYWLNSHDPDFDARAQAICQLYVQAPQFYRQGRLLMCCDERTGMQILRRTAPTQPPQPGQPEKRAFEYVRLGTRTLPTSFGVAKHFPDAQRFDWVLDNVATHSSLELCQVMAYLNGMPFRPQALRTQGQRRAFLSDPSHKHVFHYLPVHGSWLNQVELWFSVLTRQFLRRGDFDSVTDCARRLTWYLDTSNLEQAHPYRWTDTGQPLVRGTPFEPKRRDRVRGRAWFGTCTKLYEKTLHPPRPYRRRKKLATNL